MGKLQSEGVGKWTVKAISCGYHVSTKAMLCAGTDNKLLFKVPFMAFLIQSGDYNILVDNGENERHHEDGFSFGKFVFHGTSKHLLASLEKEGLKPGDIDMVIYTHLHSDHAGNAEYFPETRSVVQKKEFENIMNPCFKDRLFFLYDLGIVPYLQKNPNLILVDGDMDLIEGIRLIQTPGHTSGHQSLVVNTVNGLRILTGDLFHVPQCAFPQMDKFTDADGVEHDIKPAPANWPVMPPSDLIMDFYDYYDSVAKIRAYMPKNDPQYLVCGHDASLMFKEI